MKVSPNEIAILLKKHASTMAKDPISVELSFLSGPPGVICRICHHVEDGNNVVLLVPMTEYYKSTVSNRHITERLPLQTVLDEYDRLYGEAVDLGLLEEKAEFYVASAESADHVTAAPVEATP